jgi:hypothetical protein
MFFCDDQGPNVFFVMIKDQMFFLWWSKDQMFFVMIKDQMYVDDFH